MSNALPPEHHKNKTKKRNNASLKEEKLHKL